MENLINYEDNDTLLSHKAHIGLNNKILTEKSGYLYNKQWKSYDTGNNHPVIVKGKKLNSNFYSVGDYYNGLHRKPLYWLNGSPNYLDISSAFKSGIANNICFSNNNNIIIGGACNRDSGSFACIWKNSELIVLDYKDENGESFKNSSVRDIAYHNSNIYSTGSVFLNNKLIAGYWENEKWNTVFDNEQRQAFRSIAFDIDGNMLLSGNIEGKKITPGFWKKGIWTPLITNPNRIRTFAGQLLLTETDTFILGDSYNSQGYQLPGYWKNAIWKDLAILDEEKGGSISDICLIDNQIVFSGRIYNPKTFQYSPCIWENDKIVIINSDNKNNPVAISIDY